MLKPAMSRLGFTHCASSILELDVRVRYLVECASNRAVREAEAEGLLQVGDQSVLCRAKGLHSKILSQETKSKRNTEKVSLFGNRSVSPAEAVFMSWEEYELPQSSCAVRLGNKSV